jgi:hypothetical protein
MKSNSKKAEKPDVLLASMTKPATMPASKPKEIEPEREIEKAKEVKKPGTRIKTHNICLTTSDEKRINEVSAYICAQGCKPSTSRVLRAGLILLQTNEKLIEVYQQLDALDGRRTK